MAWWDERLVSFDVESTGVDVEQDRIVTAAVVAVGGGLEPQTVSWLLDPGIEIAEGATAVHGITTEHAVQNGQDAWVGIADIAQALGEVIERGAPIVDYNAPFDLTMLDRECRRYGVEPPPLELARVIDPLVIGKWLERYRRGSRKLSAVCAHYGIELGDDAHDAGADALAAARLAWWMGAKANFVARHPEVIAGRSEWKRVRGDLDALHASQVVWAAEQARGLRAYFEGRGEVERAASVREGWPLYDVPVSS